MLPTSTPRSDLVDNDAPIRAVLGWVFAYGERNEASGCRGSSLAVSSARSYAKFSPGASARCLLEDQAGVAEASQSTLAGATHLFTVRARHL